MHYQRIVHLLFFCLVNALNYSHAVWLQDLVTPRGMELGGGLTAQIFDTKQKNATFFDRIALKMDYGDVGVIVGKKREKKSLEFNFHVNPESPAIFEGRGKKDNSLPFLIGFKAATLVTGALGMTKMIVLKSLMLAKMALLTVGIILISKLFHKEHHQYPSIEIEQHGSENYPVFAEHPYHSASSTGPYHPSGGQYYAYNNAPSAAGAESIVNYATVEAAAAGNGTEPVLIGQNLVKRTDNPKRKTKLVAAPSILTIRRYTTLDS